MTSATTYAHLTGTYTIDGSHSRIGFVARHAMVTKVRGSFNEFEGSFTLDGENPANSSANVTIQTKSVDTRNADRDGHLRTNDFLSVEQFPTITFTSTGIKQTGEDTFDVTGDLTVKDVTKQVTIPFEFGGAAKDPFGNDRVGFEGSTTINRSDYGVTFNAALETGGVLVSDKITLEFEISAIKNA
ncbi:MULTISPECIES: YceI family protein [Amycolatopsis]|uniref:Polyisoprenoid-binding protein n=1 Tax=Amycolatopsis dendrobii TaxID=2760662 RepID=A0A7W3VYK1_9PSEU|nr:MULTISPECIES: YceI family protein [Amycolatopsis]MBB1155515.1 polyisoprenoid-binding protein [Amycolatopsis dendrobii]UKD54547.1 YceI family protein [Amycolatopsis sp. FU40]